MWIFFYKSYLTVLIPFYMCIFSTVENEFGSVFNMLCYLGISWLLCLFFYRFCKRRFFGEIIGLSPWDDEILLLDLLCSNLEDSSLFFGLLLSGLNLLASIWFFIFFFWYCYFLMVSANFLIWLYNSALVSLIIPLDDLDMFTQN